MRVPGPVARMQVRKPDTPFPEQFPRSIIPAMDTSLHQSSLWWQTAASGPDTPPLSGSHQADVCVIGGGYTGLSAALHLAEGGTRVVVLEAEHVGFGASGRNHGQVVPVLSRYGPDDIVRKFGDEPGERFNRFVGEAARLVFDLIERHGIECDAQRIGWLLPVDSPARADMVHRRAEAWAERGMPVSYLDADATSAVTGSDYWKSALRHDWGGNIQPLSYARGLAHAAIRAGATIHGRSPATGLVRSGNRWTVATDGGTVSAETVILATNAYTGHLWPGLRQSVVPFRLFLGATTPQGDNVRRTLLPGGHSVSDSRTILWAFRWDRDGRMVLGGDILLPWRGRTRTVAVARKRLSAAFPEVGEADFGHVWDGKVAMTMDRLPRAVELGPGVWAALGYNGRGVALATAMGRLLAHRCMSGIEPDDPVPAELRSLQPVPFHTIAVPAARAVLLHYRRLDSRAEATRR